MSTERKIFTISVLSWSGRIVGILSGLLLIPILFRLLKEAEVGLWMFFSQTLGAAAIFDLGFHQTLTRRIALTVGRERSENDLPPQLSTDMIALIGLGRRVYNILGMATFVLSAGLGLWLLQSHEVNAVSRSTAAISWLVLCGANAIVLRSGIWSCILQGTGYVGWDSSLTTVIQLLGILAQIVSVLLGGGIVGLSITVASISLLQRILFIYIVYNKRPQFVNIRACWNKALFRGIFPASTRAWVTGLGAILVWNTDQFFISSTLGLADVSAYRAANVVVHNFNIVAVTFGLTGNVFVSHLWAGGETEKVHDIVKLSSRLSLAIMISAAWPLMIVGDKLFTVWLGRDHFVGYTILGIFLATEIVEAHCYALSTASRATEDEAFAVSSLTAGIVKIIGAFFLTSRFGLVGLSLSTPLALMTCSNWYMVYRALHRLKISGRVYIQDIILPSVGFAAFVGTGLLISVLVARGLGQKEYSILVLCVSVGASLMGAGMFVLTPKQRLSLFAAVRRFLVPA